MSKKKRLNILITIFDYLRLACIIFLFVFLITEFIFPKRVIHGTSMAPTLQDEQNVYVNGIGRFMHEIERFDIVVVKKGDQELVKRVIGLPNEKIEYKKGKLYVNNELAEEDFLDIDYVNSTIDRLNTDYFTQDFKSEILGIDEYFVMGDNRNVSLDSRSSTIGPFKRENIIANGVLVINAWNDFEYIQN